jgi:pyrroloquinoline quinone (PQQ) biosynthesis protein C
MFHELVTRLSESYPEETNTFRYYLERHIEVDGDHHSQLALEMVQELCGNDPKKWAEATIACEQALRLRKGLWDVVVSSSEVA